MKKFIITLAALCGFFIAQNALATCSNYVTYSDGQVLTAGSLNSLQTNYTNCVQDIENGYDFTGNSSVTGTFSVTGNATFDTSTLFVDATNNRVGVGTTSPSNLLDIRGTSPSTFQIALTDDSNRGGRLTATGAAGSGSFAVMTASSGYALTFGIDSIEKMRLGTSGVFIIGGQSASIDDDYLLQVYQDRPGDYIGSILKNTSNTSGSHAVYSIQVGGASAGDPMILWDVNGVQTWYAGVDNSDNDFFKIGAGSTVGSNTYFQLGTTGRVYFPSHITTASGANAYLDSGTGELLRSTSSARYKKNITDLELDPSLIYSLRPVSYDDKATGNRYFGLIAEEVEEIFPQLVDHNEDGAPEYVFYERLSVLLLAEIKNLKSENEVFKARLTAGGL